VTVRVVKATFDHALQVAEHMREADRAEVWATSHSTPWQATTEALRVSTAAWAGLYDGRAVCVFGVAPINMIAGIGSPWLLGTEELVERPAAPPAGVPPTRRRNWLAIAGVVVLLLFLVLPIMYLDRAQSRANEDGERN
jgi:hypothetical protein